MELAMFKHELEEVKSTNFNGISIMDCPASMLNNICFTYLSKIDDYQQCAADNNNAEALDFFTESYNELEEVYRFLRRGGIISINTRNSLRMLLKETEKVAAISIDS